MGVTDQRPEEKVTAALEALPRDLRRDPYGYDLHHDALFAWACFALENYLGVDAIVTRHDLAGWLADENILGVHGLRHVGSGIEELAEEDHFLHWADAVIGAL